MLSVKFVADLLEISEEKYTEIESSKIIPKEMTCKITRLFGVEEKDIFVNQEKSEMDIPALGLARSSSNITPKDQKEIMKLVKLREYFNDIDKKETNVV